MLFAQTGVLELVDGSCKLQCGETTVMCSVTGPIEPKARQELPAQLALEIVVRPCRGVPSTREKLLEDQVRGVVTPVLARYLYPRQLAQLCFQILESGEPEELYSSKELSACINAAFLALVDAGIGIQASFASVCLSILEDGQRLLVNPSQAELIESRSTHVLALQLAAGAKKVENLLLLESYGDFDEQTLLQVLQTGEEACVKTALELRKVIEQKLQKDFVWR
ncbi:LANO_0G11232g1_1 [Lachancea nothofagi CBS 11611]|uniref:LANO_0G11232g1_1 n=1 Tax=Lachancea nothofagi CBS 11611 TaxID=1266666 RepID=A0A1G4KJQ6_9SACH|nr:LANO_0G11232g1_1 [Lachancea nothofagi CBS 11611]